MLGLFLPEVWQSSTHSTLRTIRVFVPLKNGPSLIDEYRYNSAARGPILLRFNNAGADSSFRADLNPSFSTSHILILSSNFKFDTVVVLVVMFIT